MYQDTTMNTRCLDDSWCIEVLSTVSQFHSFTVSQHKCYRYATDLRSVSLPGVWSFHQNRAPFALLFASLLLCISWAPLVGHLARLKPVWNRLVQRSDRDDTARWSSAVRPALISYQDISSEFRWYLGKMLRPSQSTHPRVPTSQASWQRASCCRASRRLLRRHMRGKSLRVSHNLRQAKPRGVRSQSICSE